MIRQFQILILLVMAGFSLSVSAVANYWYNGGGEALVACQADPGAYSCASGSANVGYSFCSGGVVSWYQKNPPIGDGHNYCTYSNTCPVSGQIFALTGECVCPSGQTVVNGACVTSESCISGELSSNVIDITQSGVRTMRVGAFIASRNGCEVTCVDDGVLSTTADGKDYQHIICEATGQPLSSSDANLVNSTPEPPVDTVNAKPGCIVAKDNNGKVIETCDTNPDSNCGTVNGQSVCYSSDSVKVNDETIKSSDQKNCGNVNGEFLCVVPEDQADYCVANGNNKVCFNSKVTKSETTEVVTNPDGSVTSTETKQSNIKNDQAVTKVTVQNSDGSSTVTVQGADQGTKDGAALSAIASNTSKTASNTTDIAGNTKGILDALTTGGDGEIGFDKSPVQFSDLDSALAADQGSFESFVNQGNPMQSYANSHSFTSAFSSMLPADTSCAGGIHTVIFGKHFDLEPCEKLAPLREILAWFFAVMTVWQIFNMTSKSITRF